MLFIMLLVDSRSPLVLLTHLVAHMREGMCFPRYLILNIIMLSWRRNVTMPRIECLCYTVPPALVQLKKVGIGKQMMCEPKVLLMSRRTLFMQGTFESYRPALLPTRIMTELISGPGRRQCMIRDDAIF